MKGVDCPYNQLIASNVWIIQTADLDPRRWIFTKETMLATNLRTGRLEIIQLTVKVTNAGTGVMISIQAEIPGGPPLFPCEMPITRIGPAGAKYFQNPLRKTVYEVTC